MILNIEEIEEGLTERDFTCEPSFLDLVEESSSSFVTPVGVHLQLMRRGGNVSLTGDISFSVELLCSRCARSFKRSFCERVEALYRKEKPELREGEGQLSGEEVETLFYDGETIDLSTPIRDTILLSVPIKPLCREDCKGLCPRCGKDLNEGPCDCPKESSDPRWRRLAELK